MFGNLKPIKEEDKKVYRPRGVNKAAIEAQRTLARGKLNYRGLPSKILEELYSTPLKEDMPWDPPPEFKF